jgi:hypothetical protein
VVGILEEIIARLTAERDDAQRELNELDDKYHDGGMYSTDDASMEDYLDAKVQWLTYAIWLAEREMNNAKV